MLMPPYHFGCDRCPVPGQRFFNIDNRWRRATDQTSHLTTDLVTLETKSQDRRLYFQCSVRVCLHGYETACELVSIQFEFDIYKDRNRGRSCKTCRCLSETIQKGPHYLCRLAVVHSMRHPLRLCNGHRKTYRKRGNLQTQHLTLPWLWSFKKSNLPQTKKTDARAITGQMACPWQPHCMHSLP